MGRTKKYERSDIIKKAMDVFWDHGYAATSMNELEEKLGINKFSIYAEFENKYGLFLASLDFFAENLQRPAFKSISAEKGKEGILEFFYKLPSIPKAFGHHGCFLLLAGIEFNNQNNDIQSRIESVYKEFQAQVEGALKTSYPELSELEIKERSEFLRTYLEGLLSRSRHTWQEKIIELPFLAKII